MKNYCRYLIVCLAAISIMFSILTTVNAENNHNKYIFFDDFSFELTNDEADLFVGHTGSGSLKIRDTERGVYALSKDSATDKSTVDPTFKTPPFTATSKKTVLEFKVSHTGAQDYSVNVFNDEGVLLTLVNKETERDWIDYKAIFDFKNSSVSLYINGEHSNDFEITDENNLVGQEIQFQFVGYHIRSLTAEVLFDYINIYEFDDDIVYINNFENTDVNKIEAQFVAPLAGDLTAEDISVEGAVINSVTKKDGALNLYEIEFEEKLDFNTEYDLVLDSNCVLGWTSGDISGTFTTRERKFTVKAPEISSSVLANGDCTITVEADNETPSPEDVLLNVTLYDGNEMVWTKFVPYVVPAEDSIDEDATVTLSGITASSVMKVVLLDKIDSLYPYSSLITVTTTEKTIADTYAGDRNASSTASYTFNPDSLIIDAVVNISENARNKFFAAIMVDDDTVISNINLSNPTEITYFVCDILPDETNNISYKIPDLSNGYKFWWISGDDSQLNSIDMNIYSTTYIYDALDDINSATEPYELWGFLKTYKDAFQLDVSENYNETLYQSILEMKGESFELPSQLSDAFMSANALVNKNSSNVDELISAINLKEALQTYNLYNDAISQNAVDYVKEKLVEEKVLTEDQFAEKFNFYVITGGVDFAENYKQVQKIIEQTTGFTLIDLDDYNDLNSGKKKDVAVTLMGTLYDDYADIKSAFDAAVKNAKKKSSASGGGSSGGGGTVKNTFSTPISYPTATKDDQTNAFVDMASHAWASEAVDHLVSIGAVSGKTSGQFCPADLITREETAKILAIAFELKTDSENTMTFEDVSANDWSHEYIAAVYANGVMNGVDGKTFGKNILLSRQMLATMLYRIALSSNLKLEDKTLEFADMNDVDEYAVEAIGTLYANSLINGVGNNRFVPAQNCTRAEAAKMISDFLKFYETEGNNQ